MSLLKSNTQIALDLIRLSLFVVACEEFGRWGLIIEQLKKKANSLVTKFWRLTPPNFLAALFEFVSLFIHDSKPPPKNTKKYRQNASKEMD
jgi:hypothetical protein